MRGIFLKKRNKKGFTLVELVIVVAVLVIIAGIAIPTVHNVIGNANKAADTSNAQSIELAIKTFEAETASNTAADIKDSNGNSSTNDLVDLLSAYGINLDLSKLKQSGNEYYYNGNNGKVVAASSSSDAAKEAGGTSTEYVELKKTSTYTIDDAKVKITTSNA